MGGIPFYSSSGAGQYRGIDGTKTTFGDAEPTDTSDATEVYCVICESVPDRSATGWAKRWRMLGIEWVCPTCVTAHPDLQERLAAQDGAAAAAAECPAVGQTIAAMLQADAKQVCDDNWRRQHAPPPPAHRPLAGHCDAIEERYGIIW